MLTEAMRRKIQVFEMWSYQRILWADHITNVKVLRDHDSNQIWETGLPESHNEGGK